MLIFAEITENKCINKWHPLVKGNNLNITARYDNRTQCEIRVSRLLLTYRKLHTGFRLILTSVTLNDLEVERRNDHRAR